MLLRHLLKGWKPFLSRWFSTARSILPRLPQKKQKYTCPPRPLVKGNGFIKEVILVDGELRASLRKQRNVWDGVVGISPPSFKMLIPDTLGNLGDPPFTALLQKMQPKSPEPVLHQWENLTVDSPYTPYGQASLPHPHTKPEPQENEYFFTDAGIWYPKDFPSILDYHTAEKLGLSPEGLHQHKQGLVSKYSFHK
jgi:hypothetical protein